MSVMKRIPINTIKHTDDITGQANCCFKVSETTSSAHIKTVKRQNNLEKVNKTAQDNCQSGLLNYKM